MAIPIIDHASLKEVYLGDHELLVEILEVFLEYKDSQSQAVDTAVKSRDPIEVAKAAHKFKGALLTIGAAAASDVARALELIGHDAAEGNGDLSESGAKLAQLHAELARLLPEIDKLRQ
jgi:HPt (histidine-containing phosphotransfer) domain-containing protein